MRSLTPYFPLFFSCKCIAVTPVKALFISQMKKNEIDISCNGFDRNIPATAQTIEPRITIPPAIIFGAGEWDTYANKTPNKALRIHTSISQIDRTIIPRAQQVLKIIAPQAISIISLCTTCALRGRAECGALWEVLLEGRSSSLIVCARSICGSAFLRYRYILSLSSSKPYGYRNATGLMTPSS